MFVSSRLTPPISYLSRRYRKVQGSRTEQLTKLYYAVKDKDHANKFEAGRVRGGLRSSGRRAAAAAAAAKHDDDDGDRMEVDDEEGLIEFIKKHTTVER